MPIFTAPISTPTSYYQNPFFFHRLEHATQALVARKIRGEPTEREKNVVWEVFNFYCFKPMCWCFNSQRVISVFRRLVVHEMNAEVALLSRTVCSAVLTAREQGSGSTVGHLVFQKLTSHITENNPAVSEKVKQTIDLIRILFSNLPLKSFEVKDANGKSLIDLATSSLLQPFGLSRLIDAELAIRRHCSDIPATSGLLSLRPFSRWFIDFNSIAADRMDFVIRMFLGEVNSSLTDGPTGFENELLLAALKFKNAPLALTIIQVADSKNLSYVEKGDQWEQRFCLYVAAFDESVDSEVALALIDKFEPDVYAFQYGGHNQTLVHLLLDKRGRCLPHEIERVETILKAVVAKSLPEHFLIEDKDGMDALYTAAIISCLDDPKISLPILNKVHSESFLKKYGPDFQTLLYCSFEELSEPDDEEEVNRRLPVLETIMRRAPAAVFSQANVYGDTPLSIAKSWAPPVKQIVAPMIEKVLAERNEKQKQKEALVLGLFCAQENFLRVEI